MWHHVTHSQRASKVALRSTCARELASSWRQSSSNRISGFLEEACFRTCRRSQSSTPLASTFQESEVLERAPMSTNLSESIILQSRRQKEVMKTLLIAIQTASDQRVREMANPRALRAVTCEVNELQDAVVPSLDKQLCNFTTDSALSIEHVDEEVHVSEPEIPVEEEHPRSKETVDHAIESAPSEDTSYVKEKSKPLLVKPTLQGRLIRSLESRRLNPTVQLFNKSMKMGYNLDSKLLVELFDFVVPSDVITAYKVLCRYREQEHCPMKPAMYAKLCDSVGRITKPRRNLGQVVMQLGRELQKLDVEKFQHVCFPRLMLSLIKQPDGGLGRAALPIYKYMTKNDFPLTAEILEDCLKHSRYSRQGDLPYHEILRDLVLWGHRPLPQTAIQVLVNLYPFTDVKTTSIAFKALLELQSTAQPTDRHKNYQVDIGTMEQITAAGARKSSPELSLMVWDLLELLGYQPTEGMFESTIQAFCMSYRQDDNAFAVLAEMESSGFEPPRSLIRGISRSLRFSPARADHAYFMITQADNEQVKISGANDQVKISLASLNAILSACAELGDVDRTFATYDDFESYDLKPNADSFSFLLESLAVNMHKRTSGDTSMSKGKLQSQLAAAESIVEMMREDGFAVSRHALHEYVRILCMAGEIDSAIRAVADAFERKEEVINKTLFVLVSECLSDGRVDEARGLSSMTSEPWTFLEKRIANWESSQSSPADSNDVDTN